MKIIIAGGGSLGFYLAKTMLERGHEVQLIELNLEQASIISTKLDLPVVYGDATDVSILRSAETQGADVFIAVTGKDEDNLIACQLARRSFDVRKIIARANNPDNADVLSRLGVDFVLCDASILTRVVEQEADSAGK